MAENGDNAEQPIALLLDAGVPLDAIDFSGMTALHYAIFHRKLSVCKLLVARGANANAKDDFDNTLLSMSLRSNDPDMVVWAMEQHGDTRLRWSSDFFEQLLSTVPEAANAYLDKFATAHEGDDGKYTEAEFFDLAAIYGEPHEKPERTALGIAVEAAEKNNVLSHRVMQYILGIKWDMIRYAFMAELAVFMGLLLSYFTTIIIGETDWILLKEDRDYTVMVLRLIAWLCCLYLVVAVEYGEFRADGRLYFKSFWNWLNILAYGAILATIPLESFGKSMDQAHHGLLSLISVSLWINLLQYLRIHKSTGILIATMGRMVRDVRQFLILYSVFLFGFSSALHAIMSHADGYKTYGDSFITSLLMLFGNLTYEPYSSATGWTWVFANLLLFVYLICVVIMLLNVLIAMMSTSFAIITESSEDQYWLHRAETIIRIEGNIPVSIREKQFKRLVPQLKDLEAMLNSSKPGKTIDGSATVQPMLTLLNENVDRDLDEETKSGKDMKTHVRKTVYASLPLEDGFHRDGLKRDKKYSKSSIKAPSESVQSDAIQALSALVRDLKATVEANQKEQQAAYAVLVSKLNGLQSYAPSNE